MERVRRPYTVLVADPPWGFEDKLRQSAVKRGSPFLSIDRTWSIRAVVPDGYRRKRRMDDGADGRRG